MAEQVTQDDLLDEYRLIWQGKPTLQAVYYDYYKRLVERAVPGRTLEIGGGSGNLKAFLPGVVSTDILTGGWLDARADAQRLPFRDASFANIVFVDVLHHLQSPTAFFHESVRVLQPGGRLLMIEPAITPVSYPALKWFHAEPVLLSADPLDDPHLGRTATAAFDANQAIPTLMFGRHRRRFESRFPELTVDEVCRLSLIAYPLSGGFRPWSLMPARLAPVTIGMERKIERMVGWLMGFRLLVALTRTREHSGAQLM